MELHSPSALERPNTLVSHRFGVDSPPRVMARLTPKGAGRTIAWPRVSARIDLVAIRADSTRDPQLGGNLRSDIDTPNPPASIEGRFVG